MKDNASQSSPDCNPWLQLPRSCNSPKVTCPPPWNHRCSSPCYQIGDVQGRLQRYLDVRLPRMTSHCIALSLYSWVLNPLRGYRGTPRKIFIGLFSSWLSKLSDESFQTNVISDECYFGEKQRTPFLFQICRPAYLLSPQTPSLPWLWVKTNKQK